jgi:hypothetical protein
LLSLEKALYGCLQSAKLWYLHLRNTLEELGFAVNAKDQCIFNKVVDGSQITVCVYVDDLLITSTNTSAIESLIESLTSVYKELKLNRGNEHSYLGMTLTFCYDNDSDRFCKVSMKGQVDDILKEYEVVGTAPTPACGNLHSINENAEVLSDERHQQYHSRVARLLYLAKRVAPEIMIAVNFLATRVVNATVEDWKKLDRVLKYLNERKDPVIVLKVDGDLTISAFIDASHAVHRDMRGQGGMVITLGSGPVFIKSWKLKLVTKSSTESELVALSDGLSQVIWLRDFLLLQGYEVPAAKVYQDNQSTIALSERGFSNSERTRHINIRYFLVKDRIDSKEIQLLYLATEEMVADILTKPLLGEPFRVLRERMAGRTRTATKV